jgi:AraC-like DNA-binding protein
MTENLIAEAWHHDMESIFGGLEVVSLSKSSAPVSGALTSTDFGSIGIYGMSGTAQQLVRSPRAVRQSPTELLKVCAMQRGRCIIEQSGHQYTVNAGELGLYDTAVPYRLTFQSAWQCEVMTAPSAALASPRAVVDKASKHPWSSTTGAGTVLAQFISACAALPAPPTAGRDHLAAAGASLLAGVVLQDFEAAADRTGELFRHEVESHIDRNLHAPDLNLESIAAAHHVSVRTVQRLFAGTGQGVTGFIRSQRLQAVRRDLADLRSSRLTIAEVAARWCIHDAQWLAKSFKSEFGISPSEFRRSSF